MTTDTTTRDEDRAWYDLARALRVVSSDLAAAPSVRLAERVQSSVRDYEGAVMAAALRGAGHARPDPVEARLSRLSGRPLTVLRWLRSYGPALEFLAADRVREKRGVLLDDLASAVATIEDRQRWIASGRETAARRQWARLRLREAWAAWYGETW